jgi:hypothetical protein
VPILANSWPSGEELLLALLVFIVLPLVLWLVVIASSAVGSAIWARKMKRHGWLLAIGPPLLLMTGVVAIPPGFLGLWWLVEQIPPPEERPPADCTPADIDITLLGTPCDPEDQERCGIMDGYYCSMRLYPEPGEPTHLCEALCRWDCQCPTGYVCMNANCRPEEDPFAW